MPTPKVAEINDYIKSMDATLLDVDTREPGFFTRDVLQYNKRGLGRLAATIKKWARENGHTHEATPGNHKQRRYQETQPIKMDAMYRGEKQIHRSSCSIYCWQVLANVKEL